MNSGSGRRGEGPAGALPDLTAVATGPRGLRRVLMGERKKQLNTILPLLSPDPPLRAVAIALAEHEAEPDLATINLRTNLRRLLASHGYRPSRDRLRLSFVGERVRFRVRAHLAGARGLPQMETGIASAEGRLLALIRLAGDWRLAMPSDSRNVRIDPVFPASFPPVVGSLQPRPARISPSAAPVRLGPGVRAALTQSPTPKGGLDRGPVGAELGCLLACRPGPQVRDQRAGRCGAGRAPCRTAGSGSSRAATPAHAAWTAAMTGSRSRRRRS